MSNAGNRDASQQHNFKVVLLGEGCVGKTSLVLRYVENKFNDKHITTLQASFLVKKLNINGKRINLSIWDTAGQEKFHALGPIYYRGSNGAILVYDITDKDSFQKVKNWVKELRKMLGAQICLVIAGNKTDLDKNRHVSNEDAETYASQVGATLCYTSAKLNQGIEEMFLTVTQKMIEMKTQELEQENSQLNRQNSTRRNVLVVDDNDTQQNAEQQKNCCSS